MINNQIKFPIIVNSSNYNFIQYGSEKIIELNKKLVVNYNKLKGIILNSLKEDHYITKIMIDIIGYILSKINKYNFNIYDVNNKEYLYKNDTNNNIINIYHDKINNIYYPWRLLTQTKPEISNKIYNLEEGIQIKNININNSLSFYYTLRSYTGDNINISLATLFKNDIYKYVIDPNYITNDKWNSLLDKYINDIKNNKHKNNQKYYIGDDTHPIYNYLNEINIEFNKILDDINDHSKIENLINDLDDNIKKDINNYIENNNIIINKINKKFNGILYYSNQLIYNYEKLKNKSLIKMSNKNIKIFTDTHFINSNYSIVYYINNKNNININDENNINFKNNKIYYNNDKIKYMNDVVEQDIKENEYDKLFWFNNTLYIKI